MRGRKPIPTERKLLEGNPGHHRLNLDEPRPPIDPDFVTPPPELDSEIAKAEWRRLAPMLTRIRQVTDADRSALVAVCIEWSRYIEATRKIQQLGLVIRAPSGYPIQNPYLSIATKALAGCNKLWPELGLTPSSRSRVTTGGSGPGPGGDEFSEFDEPPESQPH